jgi:hypothetical protein
MCGRFLNKLPAAEMARIFRTRNAVPNDPERYNAPTDPVLAVRFNPKTGEPKAREGLDRMRTERFEFSATPGAAATAKRLRQSAAALSSALPLLDRRGVMATHETLRSVHLSESP